MVQCVNHGLKPSKRRRFEGFCHIRLYRSDSLGELADFLGKEKPDFDLLSGRYLERFGEGEEYPLHNYVRVFKQLFLERGIEKAVIMHPTWNIDALNLSYLRGYKPSFDRLGNVRIFKRTRREKKIYRMGVNDDEVGREPLFSYGQLISVGGIPAIIEYCRMPGLNFRRNKVSVLQKMCAGRECGYIMLAHRENRSNPNERYFLNHGGYMAVLGFSEEDFRKGVKERAADF
jgi:hypothetical protein